MKSENVIYVKASPRCIDIDTGAGGERFSTLIRASTNGASPTEIILDLSGNVRLDYWGCSRVVDTCLSILAESSDASRKTITVLTSLRYEEKDSYAWLFFNKCQAASEIEISTDRSVTDLAIAICNKFGVEFKLFKVPLRFSYEERQDSLRTADVVLSSR